VFEAQVLATAFDSDRGVLGRIVTLNEHAFTSHRRRGAVCRGTNRTLASMYGSMMMRRLAIYGDRLTARGAGRFCSRCARLKTGAAMARVQVIRRLQPQPGRHLAERQRPSVRLYGLWRENGRSAPRRCRPSRADAFAAIVMLMRARNVAQPAVARAVTASARPPSGWR